MARSLEEILKSYSDKKVLERGGKYSEIINNIGKPTINGKPLSNNKLNIKTLPLKIKMSDVLKQFKPEELIEAIGIEKVQSYLRKKKIEDIKK
jgi:hypothetical protein